MNTKHCFLRLLVFCLIITSILSARVDESLELPEGFKAYIFADNLGRARHITVNDNGDVYVALRELKNGKGLVALRDTDNDHIADEKEYFFDQPGTGIHWKSPWLYFAPDTAVYRMKITGNELLPKGEPEQIVRGLPLQRQHAAKTMAFDNEGNLYLNIGAPANACQEDMRTPGSPGIDPCPLLENYGGIWRFDAAEPGQYQADAYHFATGLRHCVAIDWNSNDGNLYVVQHGRDQLYSLWKKLYSKEDNARLPAEEFLRVQEGSDFGWPYCYYDHHQNKKVLAPEYGGDGKKVGRCADAEDPLIGFPAHWAPNDLLFYTGDQFPGHYHNGAFTAFHGSWNRSPFPQEGYRVVFVPFKNGEPKQDWESFANGFSGAEDLESPYEADYRPMGLAQSPDGSLYITDSVKGRVWKIVYDRL